MVTTDSPIKQTNVKAIVFNAWRAFIAIWYLGGCVIHFLCGIFRPYAYAKLGQGTLYPFMARTWTEFFMPHISFFALLLAAMELAVGIMLLSRNQAVKIALTVSILFNLFLFQLGLGFSATPGSMDDFVRNRLSLVLFVLIQLPLYWVRFDRSFPAVIRAQSRRKIH
jgi:hypothetical protein